MALKMCLIFMAFNIAVKGFSTVFPGCNSTGVWVLMKFITLLIVCCVINTTNADRPACKGGTIYPSEPYFLLGQNINMTCNRKNGDSSKMYFKTNNAAVEDKYITRVNSTAIMMVGPKVTASLLENHNDRIIYFCMMDNGMCLHNKYVTFDYYPLEAQNVTCLVYNWRNFSCTWSLGVEYKHENDNNVSCRYVPDNTPPDNTPPSVAAEYNSTHEGEWTNCPNENRTSCFLDNTVYTGPLKYWLKITVTNVVLNISVTTGPLMFIRDHIVEPAAVTRMQIKETNDSHCMEVCWQPATFYRNFTFNLTFTSTCSKPGLKVINFTTKQEQANDDDFMSTTLCSLNPHTFYNFRVTGRFVDSNGISRGYWSKPTDASEWTNTAVPQASPEVTEGLYEILPRNKVRIYWKVIGACDMNSDTVKYIAACSGSSVNSSVVSHPQFSTTLDMARDCHMIKILASNKDGESDHYTNLAINQDSAPVPSELRVWYNRLGNCHNVSADILIDHHGNSNFTDISHTIVWCIGETFCKEQIQWRDLQPEEISVKLKFEQCHDRYLYGLITKGHLRGNKDHVTSTGIRWAQCTYEVGKVTQEPLKNVHMSPDQPSNGFKVGWDQYDCNKGTFIANHLLKYCISTGEETCTCAQQNTSVNVSRLETSHTVNDLEAGTHYCIWIAGAGQDEESPTFGQALSYKIPEKESLPVWAIVLMCVVAAVAFVAIFILGCRGRILKRIKEFKRQGDIDVIPITDIEIQPLVMGSVEQRETANENSETKLLLSPYEKDSGAHFQNQTVPYHNETDSGAASLSTGSSSNEHVEKVNNHRHSCDSAVGTDRLEDSEIDLNREYNTGMERGYGHASDVVIDSSCNTGLNSEFTSNMTSNAGDHEYGTSLTAEEQSMDMTDLQHTVHGERIDDLRNSHDEQFIGEFGNFKPSETVLQIEEVRKTDSKHCTGEFDNSEKGQNANKYNEDFAYPYMVCDGDSIKPRSEVKKHLHGFDLHEADTDSLNGILSETGGSLCGSVDELHDLLLAGPQNFDLSSPLEIGTGAEGEILVDNADQETLQVISNSNDDLNFYSESSLVGYQAPAESLQMLDDSSESEPEETVDDIEIDTEGDEISENIVADLNTLTNPVTSQTALEESQGSQNHEDEKNTSVGNSEVSDKINTCTVQNSLPKSVIHQNETDTSNGTDTLTSQEVVSGNAGCHMPDFAASITDEVPDTRKQTYLQSEYNRIVDISFSDDDIENSDEETSHLVECCSNLSNRNPELVENPLTNSSPANTNSDEIVGNVAKINIRPTKKCPELVTSAHSNSPFVESKEPLNMNVELVSNCEKSNEGTAPVSENGMSSPSHDSGEIGSYQKVIEGDLLRHGNGEDSPQNLEKELKVNDSSHNFEKEIKAKNSPHNIKNKLTPQSTALQHVTK